MMVGRDDIVVAQDLRAVAQEAGAMRQIGETPRENRLHGAPVKGARELKTIHEFRHIAAAGFCSKIKKDHLTRCASAGTVRAGTSPH